jgi:putative transposase
VYPYLLRNLEIMRPDQVWSADITYVPLRSGYLYLMAILDWYSRYVLAWRLSNSLDSDFCVAALEEALGRRRPEIFNTDQGVQFTSREFTGRLEEAAVSISMDGRGRALDNVFVERLWRSVKYEEVYLKAYATGTECHAGLSSYLRFYCEERPHQALEYRTPGEVYRGEPACRWTTKEDASAVVRGGDRVERTAAGRAPLRDLSLRSRSLRSARPAAVAKRSP